MLPPSALSAAAPARIGLTRLFGSRRDVFEASITALASMLHLPPDADHVVVTDLPEPFSPEAAFMALISDASDFSRTRLTAIAGCPQQAGRLKAYCSDQFIHANVVEDAVALAQAERIIASRAAAAPFQQALVIRRAAPQRRALAAVGPLRDIVDQLAPHSFPLHFSFKQHGAGTDAAAPPSLIGAAPPSPLGAAGLGFSDGTLAFTHRNTVILRRNAHSDVVIGSGGSGFKDGAASAALFSSPSGVYFDAGRGGWLVADTLNHCVRYISPDMLTVSTLPPPLFARLPALSSVPAKIMPPLQLSHNALKQRIFLQLRRWTSRLNLPPTLSHLIEWIMTGLHFGRGKSGWQLNTSLSLQQFSDMSRFFRFSEVNVASHVPLWRPQRIHSDGAGGYVVVSQGSLFAWHVHAAGAASAFVAADEQVRDISRKLGVPSVDSALIAAALAGGKRSICIGGSLYKLDNNSSSDSRITLLKTGVFDGAVSPSGGEIVSFGPHRLQPTSKSTAL